MKRLLFSIAFLSLAFCSQAQFRLAVNGTPSWSSLGGNKYQATVTFHADLTGNSYAVAGIVDTMRLFTSRGQVFELDSVWDKTFSQATLRVAYLEGTSSAPVGQSMVYNPNGSVFIPDVPFGSTGATAQLNQAVVTYNATKSGTGSPPFDSTDISAGGIGNTDYAALSITGSKIAANAIDSTKIAAGTVANSDLANMAAATIKGSVAGGVPADLSKAQAQGILSVDDIITWSGVADGATNLGTMSQGTQYPDNLSVKTFVDSTDAKLTRLTTLSGIDTIASYTALRAYTGTAKTIYITDTRTAGLFVAIDTSGVDNGATIIKNGSRKWARVWDGNTFQAKWLPVAGSWDSLRQVSNGFPGKKLVLEKTTYNNIRIPIAISGTGYEIDGGGAVLKLATQAVDSIISGTSGTNTLVVNDATGFQIGMYVSIITGNSSTTVSAFQDGSYDATITNIVGTTITLSRNLGSGGATKDLADVANFFRIQGYALKLKNVTFDGNRLNRSANYAWQVAMAINSNNYIESDSCNYLNLVNTALYCRNGTFTDNYADSLATFSHFSNGATPATSERTKNYIARNTVNNCGLEYAASGHSESVWTFSNNVHNTTIENNYVYNPRNSILQVSDDDYGVVFRNNKCYGDKTLSNAQAFIFSNGPASGSSSIEKADIVIEGNILDKVGNIRFAGLNLSDGRGYYRVKINNNTTVNALWRMEQVAGVQGSNNMILFDSTFSFQKYKWTISNAQKTDKAAVLIQGCQDVLFENTQVLSSEKNDSLYIAIFNAQNAKIQYNGGIVKGFHVGIDNVYTTATTTTSYKVLVDNFLIEVEGITAINAEAGAIGARITRGNILKNCTIRAKNSGVQGSCIVTAMSNDVSSDNVGVTVVNNRLETDGYYVQRISTGLNHTDHSTIMGNTGFSDGAVTLATLQPGISSIFEDCYHESATVGRVATINAGNWFVKDNDMLALTIILPLWIDTADWTN